MKQLIKNVVRCTFSGLFTHSIRHNIITACKNKKKSKKKKERQKKIVINFETADESSVVFSMLNGSTKTITIEKPEKMICTYKIYV